MKLNFGLYYIILTTTLYITNLDSVNIIITFEQSFVTFSGRISGKIEPRMMC